MKETGENERNWGKKVRHLRDRTDGQVEYWKTKEKNNL